MKVLSADFVTSASAGRLRQGSGEPRREDAEAGQRAHAAGRMEGIPHDGLAQVAVAGRSNVGKSSLLNALCRAKVARTSAAPGKTRLANVYRVGLEGGPGGAGRWGMYFVDLPGYGYARGGPEAAEELRQVAEAYLSGGLERGGGAESAAARAGREPRLVLLLVDARHPGLEADLGAGRWLASLGITPLVVATKIDKLSRSERVRNLKSIGGMFDTPVQPVSALRGEGLDELWITIAKIARDVGRAEGISRAPAGPPPKHRSSS